jgi:hypothetical protein
MGVIQPGPPTHVFHRRYGVADDGSGIVNAIPARPAPITDHDGTYGFRPIRILGQYLHRESALGGTHLRPPHSTRHSHELALSIAHRVREPRPSEKMRAAGCTQLVAGIDSGNEEILTLSKNGLTKEEARQGARLFRHALRRNSTSTSSSGSTQFDFSNELERDFGAKCGFYMMVPFRHRVQGL